MKRDYIEYRIDDQSLDKISDLILTDHPKKVLEIGSWEGGDSITILNELLKHEDKYPFKFYISEKDRDKNKITELAVRLELPLNSEKIHKDILFLGDIMSAEIPQNIDLLIIDTDHDKETSKWIFDNVLPNMKSGGKVIIHDWCIKEIDGEFSSKSSPWPEMEYYLDLLRNKKFPLKKIEWIVGNAQELGIFEI